MGTELVTVAVNRRVLLAIREAEEPVSVVCVA
jgi:hypothetical protein